MKNKRLIVVLGMHRSGSSAITKGLEVMGVKLGSHLMSADKSNEKGYFEDVEIHQLNAEILKVGGHDWNTLSVIHNVEFQGDQFTPLKNRAIEILKKKMDGSDLWGIKNPRFCRLLPFWIEIFNKLQLKVSFVIILRNPESIAASLMSRDGYPRVKSLYLWLEHMIPVFRETTGFSRYVVEFDQLITQPRKVIETLACDLELTEQLDQKALKSYEEEFIDASLKHHQWEPNSETGFTPSLIAQLSKLLDHVANNKSFVDSVEFKSKISEIEDHFRDRSDILAYIDTLDSIIVKQRLKIKHTDTQIAALSNDHNKALESLKSKEKILTTRNAQIKRFKNEISNLDAEMSSLKLLYSELKSTAKSLEHSVTERDSQIQSLTRSLSKQEEKNGLLESSIRLNKDQVNALIKQTGSLKQQIASNISDSENLAHQLDEIQSSLFWKISIISRKFWQFFEFIFMSKKE